MSKHTPGPWKANQYGEIECKHGTTIANCLQLVQWQTPNGGIDSEEFPYEANARLMAAAPELLEFVEDVAEGLDTGGNPGYLEYAVENLEERAQRIIARIKGDE